MDNQMDNLNQLCINCDIGYYVETSVMDDINGVLHCSECNNQIDRYYKPDNEVE